MYIIFTLVLMKQNNVSWNYRFHVLTIIQSTVDLQYSGIKITKQCSDVNYVKSVRTTFCVNLETYCVHIESKCGKNLHQKKLRTRILSTQWSSFVVHKPKFLFVSTLRYKFISLV